MVSRLASPASHFSRCGAVVGPAMRRNCRAEAESPLQTIPLSSRSDGGTMTHVLEVGQSPQKNICTSCGAGRVAAPKGIFYNGLLQSLPPLVSVYFTKVPHKAHSPLEDIGKRAGAGGHGQIRKASGGAASSIFFVQLADLAKINHSGKYTQPVWSILAGCSRVCGSGK